MKKNLLLLATLSLMSACIAWAAEKDMTSDIFKYHMHRIYDSFTNATISYQLKEYDITGIYLQHLLKDVAEVRTNVPEVIGTGAPLNREKFLKNLDGLERSAAGLKDAVARGESGDVKELSNMTFNACVGCHEEARLKYLFKHPHPATLFEEYMHKVNEHLNAARASIYEVGYRAEAEENLKLIGYYLGLLEDAFPESGPSGVIMDKENFKKRLNEVKGLNEEMIKKVREKKPVDIEKFRRSLNGLCVACHEPERLK